METRGKFLESVLLDNGLCISFYDQSRPVAGDRCLVQLLIDLPIPLDVSIVEVLPDSRVGFEAFMACFGPALHYQLTKTRHFVPKEDVAASLSELRQEFTSTGLAYLQHADFGKRYVLKYYQEWLEKEKCRLAHAKAIESAEPG